MLQVSRTRNGVNVYRQPNFRDPSNSEGSHSTWPMKPMGTSNQAGPDSSTGPFNPAGPFNPEGPFSNAIPMNPWNPSNFANSATKRNASHGRTLAIVAGAAALVVLIIVAMALHGVTARSGKYPGTSGSRPYSSGSTATIDPQDEATGANGLTAKEACDQLTKTLQAVDGSATNGDYTKKGIETLRQDQTKCAAGADGMTGNGIDLLHSDQITALDAWYMDVKSSSRNETWMQYEAAGTPYYQTVSQALDAYADASGDWDSDSDDRIEAALKLRSVMDDAPAHRQAVMDDLHAREGKVAQITAADGETSDQIWAAIKQTAADLGVKVKLGSQLTLPECAIDNASLVGFYCSSDLDSFYVVDNDRNIDTLVNDSWTLDVVKHELSHRSIQYTCSTTAPQIAERYEAVTNAYAQLYMGMDAARNRSHQSGYDDYAYGDAEIAIAQRIHNGECSAQS